MNYSKQREVVKEIVMQACDHPTAEEVLARARKRIPNIGVSTVYRNLNTLVDLGEIRRVHVPGHPERFDPQTMAHAHAICSSCNKVYDLMPKDQLSFLSSVCSEIELPSGFVPQTYDVFFYGDCCECAQNHS